MVLVRTRIGGSMCMWQTNKVVKCFIYCNQSYNWLVYPSTYSSYSSSPSSKTMAFRFHLFHRLQMCLRQCSFILWIQSEVTWSRDLGSTEDARTQEYACLLKMVSQTEHCELAFSHKSSLFSQLFAAAWSGLRCSDFCEHFCLVYYVRQNFSSCSLISVQQVGDYQDTKKSFFPSVL